MSDLVTMTVDASRLAQLIDEYRAIQDSYVTGAYCDEEDEHGETMSASDMRDALDEISQEAHDELRDLLANIS